MAKRRISKHGFLLETGTGDSLATRRITRGEYREIAAQCGFSAESKLCLASLVSPEGLIYQDGRIRLVDAIQTRGSKGTFQTVSIPGSITPVVVPIIEPQDAPIVVDRINLSLFARECASNVVLPDCYNCQHDGVTNSDDTCVECGVSYLSPVAPVVEPVTPQAEYVTRWTLTDLWACFNVATILVLLIVACGGRIRHKKALTYHPVRDTVSFSSGPFTIWHGGYNRGVR